MKRILAITFVALVVGLGTPAAYATEGTAESPGIKSAPTTEVSISGTAESPGVLGTAESPGLMATIFIYLDVIV